MKPHCEYDACITKCTILAQFCSYPFNYMVDPSSFAKRCSFWVWGDVQPMAKPECRHGSPCVIRKVNKDRLFFCYAMEDSCKYFGWVPDEPYYDVKFFKPLPTKRVEKHEKQYLTKEFINDFAYSLKI